jgi:hypothetical protein
VEAMIVAMATAAVNMFCLKVVIVPFAPCSLYFFISLAGSATASVASMVLLFREYGQVSRLVGVTLG